MSHILDDAPERGFTLLEIIVAMAILGMGIVMVMQLFSGGLRSAGLSRDYSVALLHARAKMEEMLLNPVEAAGEFDDGFRWHTEVSLCDRADCEASGPTRITVWVLWPAGDGERAVELVTLKALGEGLDE